MILTLKYVFVTETGGEQSCSSTLFIHKLPALQFPSFAIKLGMKKKLKIKSLK